MYTKLHDSGPSNEPDMTWGDMRSHKKKITNNGAWLNLLHRAKLLTR